MIAVLKPLSAIHRADSPGKKTAVVVGRRIRTQLARSPMPALAALPFLILALVAHPLPAAGQEDDEVMRQKEYFDNWFGKLSPDKLHQMWDEVRQGPSEPPANGPLNTINSWQLLGPLYNVNPGGGQMTGRVRDIDAVNFRVLAASGGLWRFNFGPIPMTDNIPSNWFGSFASKPSDPNTILLGTGEYDVGSGTGLYLTSDGGTTWNHQSLGGDPNWISRARWNVDGTVAYVASDFGVYRSTDTGLSWQRTLTGDATDIATIPNTFYRSLVYATLSGNGLWRSSDAGTTWQQMTGGGIPTSGTGHGAVTAIYPVRLQPVWVYVSFSSAGVWRTTDGGGSWANITPSPDVNRFWYNNVISVCPSNSNTVLLGGVGAKYTNDAGITWHSMVNSNLHADYHAFSWESNGTGVWAGNDGGWSHSPDAGVTWDSSTNVMPITQFYDIACERTEIGVMIGSSQDNNVEYTPNETLIWTLPVIGSTEGDGTGCAVDQFTTTRMWSVQGVYGGSYSYERQRTTDGGPTWQEIDNGIPANNHAARIREDGVFNPWLVTMAGANVYDSTDNGSTWTQSNATAFPGNILELTSSARANPNAVVWAPINTATMGQRLYVRDGGSWFERDAGLPAGVSIHKVATHPYTGNFTDEAWALMNGTSTPGAKIFHTTNRGATWTNITGNLPNVPVSDVVPDPRDSNRLFLGTSFGCYKSTDGGAHWLYWNNGLSDGVMVTTMTSIDTRGSGGPLYIVAGTYGRSVVWRDGSGDDPVAVGDVDGSQPHAFVVAPNPLSSAANLSFVLRQPGRTRVEVYDTGGRRVATPLDATLAVGAHVVPLDESRLPAGMYFFRLEGNGVSAVRQVAVIR